MAARVSNALHHDSLSVVGPDSDQVWQSSQNGSSPRVEEPESRERSQNVGLTGTRAIRYKRSTSRAFVNGCVVRPFEAV